MIERHLKKIEDKNERPQIEKIDFIYLLNLDQRPEKLARSMRQLAFFGVEPHRVPAIYGWDLPESTLQAVGLPFAPGMDGGEDKIHKPITSLHHRQMRPLTARDYGTACFHPRMSRGAIGCALTHLSILQDAYDAGYETIWVLEDDFTVEQDPFLLTHYLEQLDASASDWDLLFTDDRSFFEPFTPGTVWRPDAPFPAPFIHTPHGADFYEIGGRCQMHSVILRRSGIEKILAFEKRGLFLPYDVDAHFAPDLRQFNLKQNIVWSGVIGYTSDTDHNHFGAA